MMVTELIQRRLKQSSRAWSGNTGTGRKAEPERNYRFLIYAEFLYGKQITDISGRGVGLDVVKSNIEALGGDVEVKSKLGVGTKFVVRLPLTLAIIQALMVEIRDENMQLR